MDTNRDLGTYVIQCVSFGDKTSETIATVAMRKTAELGKNDYPQAAEVIKKRTTGKYYGLLFLSFEKIRIFERLSS